MAYERRSQSRTRRAGASIPVVHSHPPPAPPPPTTPHFLDPKKKTPYTIQRDYRVLEREKRVTTILNDERFRSELESILQGQKDASTHPKMTNLQKLQDEASSSSPSRVTRATGVVGSATAAVIPIDDLRGVSGSKYTVAERQTRCKLAAVYRLVDMFGWSQLIYNSITACSPGEDHSILVNPFGLLYSEVTASCLVAVDLEGHVVDPGSTQLGINKPGYGLHAAIHAARSDVKCVVHVHTNAGVAVSSMTCGLLPVSEEALSLGDISYHDGLTQEQRQQVAEDLGPSNKVLVLRNHGLVAMGKSIEEAFHITHKLVKACEIQVTVMSIGLNNILQTTKGVWSKSRPCLGGVDVESTFTILDSISRKWGPGELEFEALMRMLDNKGYNTGYRYKALSLLEPGTGKSGIWKSTKTPEQSKDDTSNDWNFLDQKKINRTEPVIRNKNKATPRRHRETRVANEHKHTRSTAPTDRRQETHTPFSINTPGLSPLAKAELTASHVAQSTGKAVERLAKDRKQETHTSSSIDTAGLSPLAKAELTASHVAQSTGKAVERLATDASILKQSPLTHTTPSPSEQPPLSDTLQSTHLTPLERAQHTAEKVAESTSHAVRKLTQDFATRSLKETRFPDHIRNEDLETSSEPSLLTGGGHSTEHHISPRLDHSSGHTSYHQSLGDLTHPDGLSPLEKVTHTAERVAGSTGVAVVKLSGSLTTTP